MQIRASQRQTATPAVRPHRVLARRWALQRRLITGSVAALVLSLLAWLFGASLPLHLGLIGTGFAGGFCWRFTRVKRRAERWAFSWIEARAGLSYLTAYELGETDSSRFGEAVRTRAAQVGRLETPPLQPWALPLIVLALALAAVPHLVLPTLRAPLAPLTDQLPGTALQTPETGAAPDAERPTPGTEPEASPETGRAAPEEGADSDAAPNTGTDAETTSTDDQNFTPGTAPTGDAADSESAALERFLEQSGAAQTGAPQSGRQTDTDTPPTDAPTGTSRSGAPPTDSGDADTEAQSWQNETEPGSSEPSQRAQQEPGSASGDDSAGAETEPSEGSPAGREATSSQNAEGEGGAEQGSETSEAQESGTEQAGSDQGDPQDDGAPQAEPGSESQRAQSALEQSGRSDSPASRPGDAAGQQSAAPNGGSETSQDPQNGAASERAGTRAGGDIQSSRERLENTSPNAPEQVNGSPADGPVSFAGETLQQGETPDTLPQTGSAESYQRAAEEVIREGRIPLEYQEIVRDYFR